MAPSRSALRRERSRPPLRAAGRSLASIVAVLSAAAMAAAQDTRLPLAVGQDVQRELSAGASDVFRLEVEAGQFLHLAVDPEALALTVTVAGPGGARLARTEDPYGDGWTRLRVSAVAALSGAHEVTVSASSARAPAASGTYRIRLDPLRPADDADRHRIQAERTQEEARRLAAQNDPASRPAAFERYVEAREAWRRLGDAWAEAGVEREQGDLHYRLGAPREALPRIQDALALYESIGDLRGQGEALNTIGAVTYELGDARAALEHYTRSRALFRQAGNRRGEAAALVNLGGAHGTLGEPDRALTAYEAALVLARAVRVRRVEGYVLRNMGGHFLTVGEVDHGLDVMRQALELGRLSGDPELEAYALSMIGRGHRLQGDHAPALEAAQEALARWRRLGNRLGMSQTLIQLGALYRAMARREEAEGALREALELTRAAGAVFGETAALLELARVEEDGGDVARARETLGMALASGRSSGFTAVEAEALYRLAALSRREGNLEGARGDAESALALKESLRSRVAGADVRAQFFASAQHIYEFQIDLLTEMAARSPAERGLVARAFEASERKRARALLDSIAGSRAVIDGGDPELRREEQGLRDRLRVQTQRQARLESGPPAREKAAALAREIAETARRYEAVQRRLEAASPAYAAFVEGAVAATAEVQALLEDGTVLVEFSLGEEKSHAWAVTRADVHAFELPPRARLASLARAALGSLGTPPTGGSAGRRRPGDSHPPAMIALAEAVLAPLRGHLEHGRVVVVADGILQHVPFAAMPEPDGPHAARPLLEHHEVVVLPSASILKALRRERRRPAPPRGVAVFADPVFDADDPRVPSSGAGPREPVRLDRDLLRAARAAGLSGEGEAFPRLPFSRQEADAIAQAAGSSAVFRAVDFAASRAAALSPALGDYRIVHFASHGLIDSDRPDRSGIVLSLVDEMGRPQDGFVRLHDIYNLELPAELVVLSACRTALGPEVRGEGLLGVVRGFMYAGAPRVVASLWDVDDRATAAVMREFYRGLLGAGQTPAAALRQAQLAVRARPQWRHPFYWAAFVVEGEWR